MSTIYDVCRQANVSMATVSRVINGNDNVRSTTRQKVLDAMDALGYKPNIIAQSLASKRSNSVGIQVSELTGPVYGPMMAGIEDELRQSNKHVFITSGHSDEAREKESIDILMSRNCDALILHVEAVTDEYLIELAKKTTPFVLINRYIKELADRCIILDNVHGGYVATNCLIEQGHTDIAYIAGPLWKTDVHDRIQGHKKALSDAGIAFDKELLFEGDFNEQTGIKGMRAFWDANKTFTAVVCANDEMAAGAMAECRDANIKVPDEVSIVGYDDINYAYYLHPKLTTVRYPVEEMGRMAAKWVLKNVYNKPMEISNTFSPHLIVRNSTRKVMSKACEA